MSTISFIQPNAIDKWLWQGQSDFWSQMLLMLGLVTMVSHSIQGVSFAHIAEALIRRVRRETLKNIMRQDVGFFDQERHTPGALTAFLAVETTQLTNISGGTLGNIVISLTTIVGGTVLSVAIGWKLALVCLSVVPLLILCGFLRFYVLQKYSKRAALVYAESAAYAAENIAAIKTVASLTLESQAFTIYRDAVESQRKSSFGSVSKSGAIYAASQAMLFLCMALGFWYGSTLLATLEYDTFQFYVCLMAVIVGTSNSGSLLTFIPDVVKAKYSASQLRLIFDRTPSIDVWEKKGRKVKAVQGYLEFRNVYFRYPTRPEKPILRGISFKVEPGQHVALVGGSGSGKSTIISLLERFYDPFIGQITIDCVDISKLHVNNYRSHIALVSQEPALFQGTIRDNICLGVESEEVSDHDIEMACRDANIYDFIASLPDGFNTDIGNAGGMLSGGQKQRIAIARAMLRNPKVLLLDEATSALDSESEHIVQTALDRASKGRTTVTIAHRLTTVQNADIIHVIEAGRIEESGNHRQLMALNGRYAELVKMQSLA
jgi:ATP-binding cassette subfamily B (MDR/TAP) protein 1